MRKSTKSPAPATTPPPASSETRATEATQNKPVHHIRYGSVKASIWRNDSAKGPFHTVTVIRSWCDENNVWHDNGSFHFKDLPHLAKAITDSHSWIAWQERQRTPKETPPKGGVR